MYTVSIMKNTIIIILVVVLLGFGLYVFTKGTLNVVDNSNVSENTMDSDTQELDKNDSEKDENKTETVIGSSVEGKDIMAYHFGEGEKNLLFVSGIHGKYEANTIALSNQVMNYLRENPETIPNDVRVSIIPALNVDGVEVGGSDSKASDGRFNANGVDLNRNFDCDWQEEGIWQNKTVSGGDSTFSEPESIALRSFVDELNPEAVVVWYAAAGGVYASSCHNGVLPETLELTRLFAKESGYPANEEFDFYEITGDATNWLAKKGIPAISVLLTNHQDVEFEKNIDGIKAVLDYYSN